MLTTRFPAWARRRDTMLKLFYELRDKDGGVYRSNQGGWHSEENLHRMEHEDAKWLAQRILAIAEEGIKHAMRAEKIQVAMVAMWANINPKGAWNAPHHHLPADWSGVFWARIGDIKKSHKGAVRDGDLLLFDPLPLGRRWRRSPTISYRPQEGTLLLFPSYLIHMVAPHSADQERISVSFNLRTSFPGEQEKIAERVRRGHGEYDDGRPGKPEQDPIIASPED